MKYKLNVEMSFVDKYTNQAHKIGDVIEVDEARGNELLNDSRKLVSLHSKIEEEAPKRKKAKE